MVAEILVRIAEDITLCIDRKFSNTAKDIKGSWYLRYDPERKERKRCLESFEEVAGILVRM